MAISQPKRARASIILALKVLQFVHQLRRRVKPRVSKGLITTVNLGADSTLGRTNLRSISRGLAAKISIQDAQPPRRVADRVCKTRKRYPKSLRSSRRVHTAGSDVSELLNASGDGVLHLLSSVNSTFSRAGKAFSSVACDHKLFLQHSNAPIYEGRSLNEIIGLLEAAEEAIQVLAECRRQHGDDWLVAQGIDVGLSIDETFIANYEHLLLRLRTDLIDGLARKVLEELLRGGRDKQQRKLLSWFTEFAGKPQALSTSFPWTIKPSLAVLWGVCWMFYDGNSDGPSSKGGNNRVPLDKVLHNLDIRSWNAPASSDYVKLGHELIGSTPQHVATRVGLENDLCQARNTGTWPSDLTSSFSRLPGPVGSQAGPLRPPFGRALQALHHPPRDTYYSHAHQQEPAFWSANLYSPHNPGTAPQTITVYPHLGSDTHSNSWHPPYSSPQLRPRHPDPFPHNPSILVTQTAESNVYTQPHPDYPTFDHIFQQGRQPEALPLSLNTTYDYPLSPFEMEANTTPVPTIMQIPHISVKHERTSSINSVGSLGIPTPVSTTDLTPILSPTSGPQRNIVKSPHTHSRQISEDRSSLSGEDDGSQRKMNYTHKRAEEPSKNTEGKMVCRFQECTGLIFERKCEWSKHMDKHDRPYKCNVKGCEKLQGFTYSGGLLRHEREVHKMHGGTKKSLFCPFADCKRSSGAGFTRKENLAEHVRRVHRRTSMSADMHGLIIRRETMERSPIMESRHTTQSPYQRNMEYREDEDISMKRKRGSDSGLSDRDNDEMRAEIKRLRHENEEKDSRLRLLEQAVMALQQSHKR